MSTWTAPAGQVANLYRPVYPRDRDREPTWEATTRLLTATTAARARLDELWADLTVNGQEDPIRVHPGGCEQHSPDFPHTGCGPVVLNGTHRVVLGLLHGTDVTVTDDPEPEDLTGWSETTLHVDTIPTSDLDWDTFGELLGHRIPAGPWVETVGNSLTPNLSGGLDVGVSWWPRIPDGHVRQAETRASEALRKVGWEPVRVFTEHHPTKTTIP